MQPILIYSIYVCINTTHVLYTHFRVQISDIGSSHTFYFISRCKKLCMKMTRKKGFLSMYYALGS